MKIRYAIAILGVLVLANVLVHHFILRWDLTEDKRYSISEASKQLLTTLEQPLEITILLDGELNSSYEQLKKSTTEMVEELGIYANKGITIQAANIEEAASTYRLEPRIIHERTHKGQMMQMTIYPYAIVKYGKKHRIVELTDQQDISSKESLSRCIENLEYGFIEAIRSLTQTKVEKIAFLEGHGELHERYVYDLTQELAKYYQIDRGVLGKETGVLDEYKVVIIANPKEAFSDEDKYILDQYLMQGGRILWVVDGVRFSDDYLSSQGKTPIIALDLNINDMLFQYGVRIKHVLVQDLQCLPMLVDVSMNEAHPNWQPMPWTYAPLLLTSQLSPITRGVTQVSATLASAIDLVGGNDGIKKDTLLMTSTTSKLTGVPAEIDLSFGIENEQSFRYANIPVAVSLEGEFKSLYSHLMPPEKIYQHAPQVKKSKRTRQVVVSAGSTIRNEWHQGYPLPLGFDRNTGMQFGHRDFMVNAVLYLASNDSWMDLRNKAIKLRLLNDIRAREGRDRAQMLSIVVPLTILVLTGITMILLRRKKYIQKS